MRNGWLRGIAVAFLLGQSWPAMADHLPASKLAKGQPESTLCGFDPYVTPMKDVLSKLGEPQRIEPNPRDAADVTYWWIKGPLKIQVGTYRIGDYPNKPPVFIEASGSDPDGICRTGRGLALGDGLADIRRLYGPRYGVRRTGNGIRTLMIQWPDETTLFLDLAEDGRVVAINVAGEGE